MNWAKMEDNASMVAPQVVLERASVVKSVDLADSDCHKAADLWPVRLLVGLP